jgi:threonine dehydratase
MVNPLPDFIEARERISADLEPTPVFRSQRLSDRCGTDLYLKAENLQKTGSYKVRGALNRIRTLDPAAVARGVVTVSAGNHAQAVAWAAGVEGLPATVVMPASAPRAKVEASRSYGATVVAAVDATAAFARARALAEDEGLYFLHPFDDPAVIAGQGTVGMEILEALPQVSTVVVPIGGGGLISGVAAYLSHARPDCRVFGVEPTGAAAMRQSLDQGSACELDEIRTIADGLAAPMVGKLNFEIVRRTVDDVVTVDDEAIGHAMAWIMTRAKLVVEPAGAAAVAALMTGAVPHGGVGPTAAILSGGNVDLDRIPSLIRGG